jgi:phage FluMu protein Com
MSSMECAQIDKVLDCQEISPSAEARQHLDQCPRCRTLYKWMREDSVAASISPELHRRIAHPLLMSLRPVTPLPPRQILIAQLLALFVVFSSALVAVLGTAGIARASLVQVVGIGVLLATGVCLFSALLARQMRPGSYHPVPGHAALGGFGLGLLTTIAVLFPWSAAPEFVAQGWPCLLGGVGVAVPAAALLWLVVRRGAPLSMPAMGATLGATAGLSGVTVLQIKCPHQEALHLLVWHGSVLAIATGAGLLAGRLARSLSRRA